MAEFPLQRLIGMTIADVSPGVATASLEVGDDLLNPNGVAHGGVVFIMVDTAMGKATVSMLEPGDRCASIDVQIRFLEAVSAGPLHAEARVIRRGRRLFHLAADVHDGAGSLVATATATFAVIAGGDRAAP